MKKLLPALIALLLVLLLCACDGIVKPAATPEPTPAPTPTPVPTVTMLLSSEEFRSYSCMEAEKKLELMGFKTIRMSEYQAWPENIFARAYYENLSEYGDYDSVPWEELDWGAPSNTIHVRFTESGRAEPAAIFHHEATITGRDIVIQVTLGFKE